jgi:hypothetical protein
VVETLISWSACSAAKGVHMMAEEAGIAGEGRDVDEGVS